jgi:predicted dehydrogenase
VTTTPDGKSKSGNGPLRVAVIGVGMMGGFHARVLSEIYDAELVAVADVVEERAKETAALYSVPTWTTDYSSLLERDDIDAVWICTPDHLHKEPTLAAAAAGKHILLEKPMATTLADCDEITQAVEQAGVTFMVGHIYRFEVHFVKLKQAIESGNIGRPVSYYGRQNTTIGDGRYINGRVGINFFLSVHGFDMMSWCLGKKPLSIVSTPVLGTLYEEVGVPDGVWSLVQFEDGVVGCDQAFWILNDAIANWRTPEGWGAFFNTGDFRWEILGTKGSCYLEFPPTVARMIDDEGWKFAETKIAPILHGKVVGALREEIQHFCACVREGRRPIITPSEARLAVELALGAERSAELHAPVCLPLDS